MTVVQILYSGLGGHSSVGFSLIEADTGKRYNHIIIFYGIEEMPGSYINKCGELGVEYFFVRKKAGLDIASQKQVIAALRKVKPAVILLHSVNLIIPVFYFRLFHKTRIIAVEHQPNHLKTKPEWVWSFLLMWLPSKLVFLTEMYREQMKKKLGIFYRDKKVSVINNGINISLFRPGNRTGAGQQNVTRLGMLARLTGTKDHATLIRSFKLLLDDTGPAPGLQLHIAGEGEMKNKLMELSRELGLSEKVYFRGMIPESAAVDFLNEMDIYVHASLGETMSTSIMQAMACGKPIVASDVMGISNMIGNGVTGMLVPAGNAEEMKIAILQLIQNQDKRHELATNAFKFAADNYSNKKMLDNYIVIFGN